MRKHRAFVVTGSRDFTNQKFVNQVLEHVNPEYLILGDCPTGVDSFAREWVRQRKISYNVHEAYWDQLGRRAGPERNGRMVKEGVEFGAICLSFPGGSGTRDCTQQAENAGLTVFKVQPSSRTPKDNNG